MTPKDRNTRQTGVALVIVLWLVAAFAMLVSAFNASVRTSAGVATSGLIAAKRHAALTAGVEFAAAELLANNQKQSWRRGEAVRQLSIGDLRLRIRIRDPNGRIDLNKAHGKLLYGLVRQFTSSDTDAERIRDRILDWRDEDSKRRPEGAEDFEYERDRQAQGAGDTPFTHKSQLRDVLGLSPELYREIAPFVTTHARNGSINPLTAPETVLKAIPSDEDDMTKPPKATVARASEATASPPQDEEPQTEADPEHWLEAEMGPAYTIMIELEGPRPGAVMTTQTTILLKADDKAPFRILSEQPRGP